MKNDIEKMRKEFEEKIRLAELENELSEPLEKNGLSMSIFSKDKATGRFLVSIRCYRDYRNPFNEHDAQLILRTFPMTEKKCVNTGSGKTEMLSYEMETHRNPKESRTILKIRYIHNDLEIWIDLPINEKNNELMQYFQRTQRKLDSDTIGLYYGAVSAQERRNVEMLPFLTWNSGRVVRFSGGHHRQISEGHLSCVAASIENDDFAWERE